MTIRHAYDKITISHWYEKCDMPYTEVCPDPSSTVILTKISNLYIFQVLNRLDIFLCQL